MGRPAVRLLSLLELLQSNRRMTGPELARRLEVSPRTIRRDIQALEALGVPLATERGRDGAYSLVAGFKLPPMMFTNDEALVLAVGLMAARGLGLAGAGLAVEAVQAKLERVLPASLQRRLRSLGRTVAFDFTRRSGDTGGASLRNEFLGTLALAAEQRRRVRLGYVAADGAQTERDVDPFGLGYLHGRWYLVGHCHRRRDVRSFRVDRLVSVEPLDEGFDPPDGFEVLAHLRAAIAKVPRAHAVEVEVRATPEALRAHLFSALGVVEPLGVHALLKSQAEDLDWFARELSRLPFDFAVRTPRALDAALAAHARRLARLARSR